MWLSLDGLLQLQDGQVVLEGGRLVVLVDDHPFHLEKETGFVTNNELLQ